MRFFYIDESGTNYTNKNSPYFILVAVCIQSEQWVDIDQSIIEIKGKFFNLAPEDVEIKGRDIQQGEGFYRSFNWAKRVEIFREIGSLIHSLPLNLFTVVAHKLSLPDSIRSDDHLYRVAFHQLLDMISKFLAKSDEYGLLLVDARSDLHSSIKDRRLIDAFREWQGRVKDKNRFLELPWFGFSSFYHGLQVADFAAYLTHSYIFKGEFADVYRLIEGKMEVIHIP